MVPISTCVYILFLALHVPTPCQGREVRVDVYKTFACSNPEVEHVMRADESVEHQHPFHSQLFCAQKCSSDAAGGGDCAYVIVRNTTKSCKLVGGGTQNFTSSVPAHAQEPGCVVGKRAADGAGPRNVSCQNGGLPNNFTCTCGKQFTGRYCENPNPSSCQSGAMEELTSSSRYDSISKSRIPVTAVFNDDLVLPVKTFSYVSSSYYFVQAHNFLDLSIHKPWSAAGLFTTPFGWKFVLHPFLGTPPPRVAVMKVASGAVIVNTISQSVRLFVPKVLDDSRLVYDGDNGTVNDVINALSRGHRKLERELSQVEFHPTQNEATFGNVVSRLKMADGAGNGTVGDWELPLTYETFLESLTSNQTDVTDHELGNPHPTGFYSRPATHRWEMDGCWTQITPVLDHDEFVSVIKEYVLAGFDIRVIVNGSVSSDVVEVEATDGDVTAQLPGVLVEGVLYKRSVVSVTKTESSCLTDFQGPTVYGQTLRVRELGVTWYVSSKKWVKLFSMDGAGLPLDGSEGAITAHAKGNGKKVRICIHYKFRTSVTCHQVTSIQQTTSYGLLFQTHASFRLSFDKNVTGQLGAFEGLSDSDCKQYVKLVSTTGWMQEAEIVVRSPDSPVTNVDFDRVDWFVEED